MRDFVKPVVLVSKCLEFEHCRYNGEMITSDIIKKLKRYTEMIPVCPEIEIGLGIPRDPLKIVKIDNEWHLKQPKTGKNLTEKMHTFSRKFLESIESLDGIIFKNRSPSCGFNNIRIYGSELAKSLERKRIGFFSAEVLKKFPFVAVGNENQLNNIRFRDHYLTKLFMLAEFREVRRHESMKNIVQFHSENKYLLNVYKRAEYNMLVKLVANQEKKSFDVVMKEYFQHLVGALTRPPTVTSQVTTLMHAFGHFSDVLQDKDREQFLRSVENYKKGTSSIYEPRKILRRWIKKFDEEYLGQQTYFEPYPDDLILDLIKLSHDRG